MLIQEKLGLFYLGKLYDAETGKVKDQPLLYSSKNLTTHAICLGMTGSGKTGLGISILEEAALDHIPSIVIDPKGDMGNLLLTFPHLSAQEFKPWIDPGEAESKGQALNQYAEEVATTWKEGLEAWGESTKRVQDLRESVSMAIYTPASKAGIPLSILSSFKAPSQDFLLDTEAMRERVLSTTSSLLGLLGLSADPIKSREHILISTIIDQCWRAGKDLDLASLIQQVQKPNFTKVGVLDLDTFFSEKERLALSVKLNNLLASPGFQMWMEGVPLDIQQLLHTSEQKPKISIISIAHLSDPERMFFVTLLLNQLISWMRKQPGTSSLRAIFYMDEIFGYFPPLSAPPSKMPMMTLLKQARAFGLGLILSTQNPVDLDYKGLSNCGTWFIGRLQTARDKARVVEGLAAASNGDIDSKSIDRLISGIGSRVFLMRSIYEKEPILFQTRWALSYLRGPLTLEQIAILMKGAQKDFKAASKRMEDQEQTKEKPIVPSSIPEYFVNPFHSSGSIFYRPFLASFSKLHFVDRKSNIDTWVDVNLTIEVPKEGVSIDWQEAENQTNLKAQLSTVSAQHATYGSLLVGVLTEKGIASLKQGLLAYLYQTQELKLYEFKELKLLSSADENEAAFRQKVAQILREQRDEKVQKLQDQYSKKMEVLREKIRKAQEKKTAQQAQSWYQRFEFFLSMLTTIVGAFFGRKVTKTTINQAGTTFRRMGKMSKESQDVVVADENLENLQQQLQSLEAQLASETSAISGDVSPDALQLEEKVIKPRKTDIAIDQMALVWWA